MSTSPDDGGEYPRTLEIRADGECSYNAAVSGAIREPGSNEGAGKVMFTFDDYPDWSDDGQEITPRTVYSNAYPIMSERDIPGVAAVIVNRLDSSSRSELQELTNNGWVVASHTMSHTNLAEASELKARQECQDSKTWMDNNGYSTPNASLIYPYSGIDDQAKSAVGSYYTYGIGGSDNRPPDYDRLAIGRIKGHEDGVVQALDQAAANGTTVIIMYHAITNNSTPLNNEVSIDEFTAVCDKVADDENLEAITTTEFS